jgi:hydroxypyruvate isomerase
MYRVSYGGGISGGRPPDGPPGWEAIGMKEAMGGYLTALHEGIDLAAANGFPNIILMAGARSASLSYDQGLTTRSPSAMRSNRTRKTGA